MMDTLRLPQENTGDQRIAMSCCLVDASLEENDRNAHV